MKPPFTDVDVKTADSGFYQGYNVPIALISKLIIAALVIWALVFPGNANSQLGSFNSNLLDTFNTFYVLAVGCFAFFLFAIALWPSAGRRKLGREGEGTEFSTFSWFAMMFGAGLGVGLMVYATAEPVGLWGSNPVIVGGDAAANSEEALTSAFRYTFLHYGFHAWAIYVVTGLSLAYYAYSRGMPLTIRSALTPLFGRFINGPIGHLVDILGIVATILGVSVTIGFGVSQLVDGLYAITDMAWLVNVREDGPPTPSTVGLVAALLVIMGMSIISAVSGVGRGVKYLSNLNLVLSLILLGTFIVFGSFLFAMTSYATALVDYILHFIPLSFEAYSRPDMAAFQAALPAAAAGLSEEEIASIFATGPWGSFESFKSGLPAALQSSPDFEATAATLWENTESGRLFAWQKAWTTFYWAWWIAFSPFVGLFLARISRGRTVREFILGCVFAPAMVCFAWMTILGGTGIDQELNGAANGAITGATTTNMLFANLGVILQDSSLLFPLTVMCVVLIITFLVTSADSGILVMNTIMSGGSLYAGIKHRIIWGLLMTLVIGALVIAGNTGAENPLEALKAAMIIGALPFTMVMVLMCLSFAKALFNDARRDAQGVGAVQTEPAE
ncbi:MAG: BCCT family transporter [Pseudomonadota bacterium]